MASELPIVTRLRSFEDHDVPDGSGSGATITERVYRNRDGNQDADLIVKLTEALREARRLICSGEQSDAVYHVHVARAAAIIDAAIAKAEGEIND